MWIPSRLHRCLACTFAPIIAGCIAMGQIIESYWIRPEWPWHSGCSNTHPKILPRFLRYLDMPKLDPLSARSSAGPQLRLPAGAGTRQLRQATRCWRRVTGSWGGGTSLRGTGLFFADEAECAAGASGCIVLCGWLPFCKCLFDDKACQKQSCVRPVSATHIAAGLDGFHQPSPIPQLEQQAFWTKQGASWF